MNTAEKNDFQELIDDVTTASDALPCNLSGYWLDRIASDLEALLLDEESQEEEEEEVQQKLCASLFLILNILEYKEEKAGNFSGEIEVRTEDLFQYFRDYLIEVSLEIVSRWTDIKAAPATLDTIFTERKVMIKRDIDFFRASREARKLHLNELEKFKLN